ncbi:MAG: PAS domain-containing sensor histidine kinase [Magnetospiraceae bacterium]
MTTDVSTPRTGAADTRYRRLADLAMEGLLLLREGRIIDNNVTVEALFGCSQQDLFNRGVADLLCREDAPRIEAHILAAEESAIEGFAVRCDGSEFPVVLRVREMDEPGPRTLVVSVRDITERRDLEHRLRSVEALEQEELRFRSAVIDSAAWGLCVCHNVPDFPYVQFTVWNDKMTEITGYTLDQINELGWYQSLYPDPALQSIASARMERMRDGDDLRAEEWEFTRADGEKRIAEISTSVLTPGDNSVHVLALIQDVTERKNLQHDILAAKRAAERANKAKTDFLANMSHELRTPLNSIIGFSELMQERLMGPMPPIYAEYADLIARSGRYLLEIINQILDLARIEAGKMELREAPTDINQLVHEVTDLLSIAAHAKQLRLSVDVEKLTPLSVDPVLLKQALFNVVGNAIKFTESGQVRVDVRRDMDGVLLDVSDTGLGMGQEVLTIALEPFSRAHDNAHTRREEGTGLGLSLTRRIVELHGGALHIWSEEGKGTRVSMFLPADRLL